MRSRRFFVCCVVALFVQPILLDSAEAAGFLRRVFSARRTCSRQAYTTTSVNAQYTGNPQAVAEQKASTAASWGAKGHLGGSFGGANAEGVGFSTYSAQNALNNCCFTGERPVLGQAVVRGADGWYACKLFQ